MTFLNVLFNCCLNNGLKIEIEIFYFKYLSHSLRLTNVLCLCVREREEVGERWPLDMASHSRLAPTPRHLPSYLAQILAFHLG